ncbi:MAG: restriction endonuclease subunit S [Pseudomonadota bacterium]|nr:restriction endonuclease subunit S [Pseudomonadota bacterium]
MAVWSKINYSRINLFQRFDGEFYKPEYEMIFDKLSSNEALPLRHFISELTDGKHGGVTYAKNGVKFIRNQNIKDGFVSSDDIRFISEQESAESLRAELKPDDLVITTIGTLGEVAIVPEDFGRATINQNLVRLCSKKINPHYLAVFLMSDYGRKQIIRLASGNVQPIIVYPNLKKVYIFDANEQIQNEIGCALKNAIQVLNEAKVAYTQAQQLLEFELGLDKLRIDKPVGYTARFSVTSLADTFDASRIDAQCFSPEAVFYEDWLLKHTKYDRLSALLSNTAKGRQQTEVEDGPTDYCSIKHISGREIIGASKAKPISGTPNATKNDLLLAITGATIGKIGIVNRYDNLVFSGDMLRMRANNEISPHYLLLTLDHHLGQVQFNRWITGSTNGHLAPRDIGRVLVPRLLPEKENRISVLVAESLEKRQESEMLLDQAKFRVEQLIEEAVQR